LEARTLRDEVETSPWQERLLAWISTLFSCFAALLTAMGLYGALDYAVKSRTREIGTRVAIGADPVRVARLLSADTVLLVIAGTVAGVIAYAASAPWIRQVLYGVTPFSPGTMISAVLFVAVNCFSRYCPCDMARFPHASRISPPA
jgi:ABC-type lipoprotein release transport system permease subunit